MRSLEFVLSLVPNPISWVELLAADPGGVSSPALSEHRKHGRVGKKPEKVNTAGCGSGGEC